MIVLLLDRVTEEEDSVDEDELKELLLGSEAEELELLRVLVINVLDVGIEEDLLLERLAELLVIALLDSMLLLLLLLLEEIVLLVGEIVLLLEANVLLLEETVLLLAETVLLDSTEELLLEAMALEELLAAELLVSEAELLAEVLVLAMLLLEMAVMLAELDAAGGRMFTRSSATLSRKSRMAFSKLMTMISHKTYGWKG